MWCDKELEGKIKLRYYKVVNKPNIEDQIYLSVLRSVKKKVNIGIILKLDFNFTIFFTLPNFLTF
jgi:hypothetical protein